MLYLRHMRHCCRCRCVYHPDTPLPLPDIAFRALFIWRYLLMLMPLSMPPRRAAAADAILPPLRLLFAMMPSMMPRRAMLDFYARLLPRFFLMSRLLLMPYAIAALRRHFASCLLMIRCHWRASRFTRMLSYFHAAMRRDAAECCLILMPCHCRIDASPWRHEVSLLPPRQAMIRCAAHMLLRIFCALYDIFHCALITLSFELLLYTLSPPFRAFDDAADTHATTAITPRRRATTDAAFAAAPLLLPRRYAICRRATLMMPRMLMPRHFRQRRRRYAARYYRYDACHCFAFHVYAGALLRDAATLLPRLLPLLRLRAASTCRRAAPYAFITAAISAFTRRRCC